MPSASGSRKKKSNHRLKARRSMDNCLGYLVRKTDRSFTRLLEHRLKKHDVSMSMWFFLRLLWETDGLTQKQLSQELGLTQPTTVSAMDILEERGLIRRQRNSSDRRSVNILLTDEGRELRKSLGHYVEEVNDIAVGTLNASEIRTLVSLLTRVNQSLVI